MSIIPLRVNSSIKGRQKRKLKFLKTVTYFKVEPPFLVKKV